MDPYISNLANLRSNVGIIVYFGVSLSETKSRRNVYCIEFMTNSSPIYTVIS